MDNEVTINVNGTNVRLDIVARINGRLTFVEVKNGIHAGYTPNQKIVYPKILLDHPQVIPKGQKAIQIFDEPTRNYDFIIFKY